MNIPSPRVLAMLPGIMPSTLMNVVKPMIALQKRGCIHFRASLENYPSNANINWSNIVLFCRNTEPRYQHNLYSILGKNIPFIYDIDDNLFEVPADTVDGQYYRAPQRLELLERYLKAASLVRVYSDPLLGVIREYNAHIQLVAPPIEWETLGNLPIKKADKPVKIVYATSRREDRLAYIFSEALAQLLSEYSQDVEMYFWGFRPPEFIGYPNVRFRKFSSNYDKFLHQFSNMGFDIGLAPLTNDRFHLSKTNNKFREYAASYIAGIYSDVEVYSNCIQDRVTGLLVPNDPGAWYSAIQTLVENAALRLEISQAARAQVENEYSSERFQDEWMSQIKSVLDRSNDLPVVNAAKLPETKAQPVPKTTQSIPKGWIKKTKRAVRSAGSPKTFLKNVYLHLSNFWWLVKLNFFKQT